MRWENGLILAVALVNIAYNATLPLHYDEAYYWVWTQRLDFSYFDHPPMIAWLLWVVGHLGQTEAVLRLVPVACLSGAVWLMWRLTENVWGRATARYALLLLLGLPILQIGYLLATPDAPLALFWAAALYSAQRALQEEGSAWWLAAGAAGGAAMLSKYTAVLLLPVLFLIVLLYQPRTLRRPGFWGALVAAVLVFLPVLYWNSLHDWASFRFQYGHGMDAPKVLRLPLFFDFWGAQAAIVNPVFFFALFYFSWRYLKVNVQKWQSALLWLSCWIPLAFFGYAALFKKAEANWPVPAYLGGMALLAYWLQKKQARKWLAAGLGLSLLLVGLAKFPEAAPWLPPKANLKVQQFIGNDVFAQGQPWLQEDVRWVLSDSYQNASLVWYYLPGKPAVHVVTPARISMYDYWRQDLPPLAGGTALYFGAAKDETILKQQFREVEKVAQLSEGIRQVAVFRCRGKEEF